MITARGSVAFPVRADGRPIRILAGELRRFATGLSTGADGLDRARTTAGGSWTGDAADGFAAHVERRATSLRAVGRLVGRATAILDQLAAAVDTACRTYSTAATAEHVAREGLPWTAGALAAALGGQTAAAVALQGAGTLAATRLGLVDVELLGRQVLGDDAARLAAVVASVAGDIEAVLERAEDGDHLDAVIAALNITVEVPGRDGSSTRISLIGAVLRAVAPRLVTGLETAVGVAGEVLAPPLTETVDPRFQAAAAVQFTGDERTIGQLAANLEFLENLRRTPTDMSMSVWYSTGRYADGTTAHNLTIPGMVAPDEGVYHRSGARNLVNAAASEVTGTGVEERALRDLIFRHARPDDTVNLFGHSQGGIVAQNLARDLAGHGLKVNVVALGSPDVPVTAGVATYLVQNRLDPVPATRVGGAGGTVSTLHRGQDVIELTHDYGGAADNHNALNYADLIARHGDDPGVQRLQRFLAGLPPTDPSRGRLITYVGPVAPAGAPIDPAAAVPAPSGPR